MDNELVTGLQTVILAIAGLALFLGAALLYVYWKRKKYTREWFAFFSFSSLLSTFATVIVPAFKDESIVTTLSRVAFKAAEMEPPEVNDMFVNILIMLGFFGLLWLCRVFYRDWGENSGGKSVREREREEYSLPVNYFADSFALPRYLLIHREQLSLCEKAVDDPSRHLLDKIEEEPLSWHIQAAELLMLGSRQYKIDIDSEWYEEENAYVSKFGVNDETMIVFCVLEEPDHKTLEKFTAFVQKTAPTASKTIVAVKTKGTGEAKAFSGHPDFEIRYEGDLLENLVDFSNYRRHINKQFAKNEVSQGCGFSLQDIYVPPSARDAEKKAIDDLESHVYEWVNEKGTQRHLAVLADYGQGKSVSSLKITHEMLKHPERVYRIPILIILRGSSPRTLSPKQLLSLWAGEYNINSEAMLKLHKGGKLLLILEGFDEIDLVGDAELRHSHFVKLWQFAIPEAKILITGRPNFFFDTHELNQLLGTDKRTGHPYTESLYINHFDRDRIEGALAKVNSSVKNEILGIYDAPGTPREFKQIISRPSTLHQASQIWENNEVFKGRVRVNSALVIQEFINQTYARQAARSTANRKTVLTATERNYFMLGIAVGMMKQSGYTNSIHKDEFTQLVYRLHDEMPKNINTNRDVFSETDDELAKQRISGKELEKQSARNDVQTSGILVRDVKSDDHFQFSHKSYLELLVSQFYVNANIRDNPERQSVVNAIARATRTSPSRMNFSEETARFCAQLTINESFDSGDMTANRIQKDSLERLHKRIPTGFVKVAANFKALVRSLHVLRFLLFALLLVGFWNVNNYFQSGTEIKKLRREIIAVSSEYDVVKINNDRRMDPEELKAKNPDFQDFSDSQLEAGFEILDILASSKAPPRKIVERYLLDFTGMAMKQAKIFAAYYSYSIDNTIDNTLAKTLTIYLAQLKKEQESRVFWLTLLSVILSLTGFLFMGSTYLGNRITGTPGLFVWYMICEELELKVPIKNRYAVVDEKTQVKSYVPYQITWYGRVKVHYGWNQGSLE